MNEQVKCTCLKKLALFPKIYIFASEEKPLLRFLAKIFLSSIKYDVLKDIVCICEDSCWFVFNYKGFYGFYHFFIFFCFVFFQRCCYLRLT